MTSREIKAALVLRNVTQADIARRVGKSAPYVNDVIAGNRRSDEIEQAVADAIGEPVEKVFPPRAAA